MKKLLVLMLILVMSFTLLLTGCGGGADTPAPVDQPEESKTVVGFIYIGHIGDAGWTDAHDLGRQALIEELGVETIIQENVPESQEIEQVVANMIDQGANVIVATSFGYMNYLENISADYPEVVFLHASGYKMTDNMGNYFGRMYEARYLSGIVAGLQTETNEIGFVAAMPIPEVIRGINAFALGVKSVNPDAKINVRWTNTWIDPAKAKEAAKALLDANCDVITQHQDSIAPVQAAAEKGVTAIGYNLDSRDMVPEAFLTAPIWNWGAYYISEIQKVVDGNWTPSSYWEGMDAGIVDLAPLADIVVDGAEEKVAVAKAAIIEGSLHVFAGPVVNQAGEVVVSEGEVMADGDMLGMFFFVDNVEGTIPTN